jgi:hypothetical protein
VLAEQANDLLCACRAGQFPACKEQANDLLFASRLVACSLCEQVICQNMILADDCDNDTIILSISKFIISA